MVSPKLMTEIRELYEALAEQSLHSHEYSGRLDDVVFEILTADSFVAGIASKLLEGDTVTTDERVFVGKPMLLDDRYWQCEDGQVFDIQPYTSVKMVAYAVERLRRKCDEVLSSSISGDS